MKSKVTKVLVIERDGRRVSLYPGKVVESVEAYRRELKEQFNAQTVLFNIEETE